MTSLTTIYSSFSNVNTFYILNEELIVLISSLISIYIYTPYIADLDKKTKLMLSIIEDDGVSFAKRAEMFYKSRPELIKLVEDLHKSYRLLAQNYDQLKYSSSILPTPRPFISPLGSSNERGVVEKKINGVGNFGIMPDLERKKMWEDLQLEVTKLMEDHLRQQAELVRRNDEKREAIKELFSQIKRLMDENRALRSCLASHRLSCSVTNLKHQD